MPGLLEGALYWVEGRPLHGIVPHVRGSLRRNTPCFVCHTCTPHLLCVVARTVGSHLLPCSLGNAPPSPLWRRAHLQGRESDFQHSMVFQNIYPFGDTKSAQELEVFLRMLRERLRLCCGIRVLTACAPMGLGSAVNSSLQHSNFCVRLSVVRMMNKGR